MVGFDFESIYDMAIAEAQPGDTIVEVGVAYGKSLAYLARKLIDSGKQDVSIVGVDPWYQQWGFWDDLDVLVKAAGGCPYQAFVNEMQKHAPEEYARCEVWRLSSTQGATRAAALAEVLETREERPLVGGGSRYTFLPARRYSFVWIDAVHDYEHVTEDIKAWKPLIRPGGILGGHDHTGAWPGVEKAVKEAFPNGYQQSGSSWWVRL